MTHYRILFLHGTGTAVETDQTPGGDPEMAATLTTMLDQIADDEFTVSAVYVPWLDGVPTLMTDITIPSEHELKTILPRRRNARALVAESLEARRIVLQGFHPIRAIRAWIGGAVIHLADSIFGRYRIPAMQHGSAFLQDVVIYESNRDAINQKLYTHIADAAARVSEDTRIVIFGHSLGGVVAVDALSTAPAAVKNRVFALITAGSQSPYLAMLGGMTVLRSWQEQGNPPIVPWRNIWDRNDFLSFRAEEAFTAKVVTDVEIMSGADFPASHLAYPKNPAVYAEIKSWLGSLPSPGPTAPVGSATPQPKVKQYASTPASRNSIPTT